MKIFRTATIIVLVNICITYGLIYYFVLSKNIFIQTGSVVKNDLMLKEGKIIIDSGSKIAGKIILSSGTIVLRENIDVNDIVLDSGTLTIGKGSHVHGNVLVKNGEISLSENVMIDGNVELPEGTLKKDSSASIKGTKPFVFITSNWPDALGYFDVLPEEHKQAVGYIFLTKNNNTIIRDPEIKDAKDYFDGIYVYKNHQLVSIDLSESDQVKKYFEKAKSFFDKLPESKLATHGVGATTKNFSMNPDKADIYVPSQGSRYTFIHEMGHVLDFQSDFSDLHKPLYPFISPEVALNGYGATHPGEDFAEAYRYYVLFHNDFMSLITEKPERIEKYDYLKKYVFLGKEYGLQQSANSVI